MWPPTRRIDLRSPANPQSKFNKVPEINLLFGPAQQQKSSIRTRQFF
jgi:hypothetical protein